MCCLLFQVPFKLDAESGGRAGCARSMSIDPPESADIACGSGSARDRNRLIEGSSDGVALSRKTQLMIYVPRGVLSMSAHQFGAPSFLIVEV